MQRVFGAIAIFAGWLSLGVGVMAGLVQSQSFGLTHVEGDWPPESVYGLSAMVVLWLFVGTAVLLAVPMAMAMVAPDPRRNLRVLGVSMAIVGIALVPDELGRFFGLPLVAGGACVWIGGELIHRSAIGAETPEPSLISEEPDLAADPAMAMAAAATPPETSQSATQAATPAAVAKPAGRGRRGAAKKNAIPERLCPWCSTLVPFDAETCPNCSVVLDAKTADVMEIPGVTQISPALQAYDAKARAGKKGPSLLRMIFSDPPIAPVIDGPEPSDADALRPPNAAVKAEMARLDAEIAAGAVISSEPGETSAADGTSTPAVPDAVDQPDSADRPGSAKPPQE